MIGIYLLVTIFSQFSPQNFWMLSNSGPAELAVKFENLSSISVGAPVIIQGQLVGTVTSVSSDSQSALPNELSDVLKSEGKAPRVVNVKISPRHRNLLRQGTVALISSPLSTARIQPETVIELFIPSKKDGPILKNGDHIVGYSSYEEFWSADLTKHQIDPASFELG